MPNQNFFATAPKNLEATLADELASIGIENCRPTRGGVTFGGGLEVAYRVCLWSRIANRVLLQLAQFEAADEKTLYNEIRKIDWSEHFTERETFAVDFNTSSSNISHSQFGALKVKDAIVDQFREQSGERPSVDTQQPDIRVNVHLYRNHATVSLDLSGHSLHQRGYRLEHAGAPLKENLAAAIILKSDWIEIARQGGGFVDLMCGSGTLPIEAALIAADIAPGLLADRFGFFGWKQHDTQAWETLIADARARRDAGLAKMPPIFGFDRSGDAIRVAQNNARNAGLQQYIQFKQRSLEDCSAPADVTSGLVVVNPPYGQRLGQSDDLTKLYQLLGAQLKTHFRGWRASVFTGNPELGKTLGLRATKINALYNGALECKLISLDITPSLFVEERRLPRLLEQTELSDGAAMFANRLRKNIKQLGRWVNRENLSCYRLYDADMPEYALAIDIYESDKRYVVAQEYEAPKSIDEKKARLRLREALTVIIQELGIDETQLFLKVRRQQKGSAQYEKLAEQKSFHQVMDGDCKVWVNFEDYLDTGLFLDHRITRQLIEQLAVGKTFLNLFAYTGVATVHAAKGGARSTTTVDMSRTYLKWAENNMALNGFSGKQHQFIQADVLEWLKSQSPYTKFDLVFLDPPTFSTSKRMQGTLDIQRDHAQLIRDTMRLLTKDGVLIFSNNLRKFKMDVDALGDFSLEDIARQTIPQDFQRNPHIHCCWKITHK